jgi:hypothetical protein
MREKVKGEWRKLYNKKLYHLWAYCLLNIIRMTKSCKARWTGYAAHMRLMRNICRFWAGNSK